MRLVGKGVVGIMVWPHAIFTRHHAYPRVQQRFGSAGAHQTRTDRPGHGVHTPSNTCTFCYIAARAHRRTEAAKSRTRRRTPRRTRPHALHGLPGDDRRRCCHARAACPPCGGGATTRRSAARQPRFERRIGRVRPSTDLAFDAALRQGGPARSASSRRCCKGRTGRLTRSGGSTTQRRGGATCAGRRR